MSKPTKLQLKDLSIDPEVQAIQDLLTTLNTLPDLAAKRRAMAWVYGKLGLDKPPRPVQPSLATQRVN